MGLSEKQTVKSAHKSPQKTPMKNHKATENNKIAPYSIETLSLGRKTSPIKRFGGNSIAKSNPYANEVLAAKAE
jgi:hypothetical protein